MGLKPGQVVRIVSTEPVGDSALTVCYKTADGVLCERMLFRADEANLSIAEAGRPMAFGAPGAMTKQVLCLAFQVPVKVLVRPQGF